MAVWILRMVHGKDPVPGTSQFVFGGLGDSAGIREQESGNRGKSFSSSREPRRWLRSHQPEAALGCTVSIILGRNSRMIAVRFAAPVVETILPPPGGRGPLSGIWEQGAEDS